MKHSFLAIVALLLFACSISAVSPYDNLIRPTDKNIRYVGRVSLSKPDRVRFTYPGVQIRAVFEGTSLRMLMKPNSGYFMVELDGKEAYKIVSSDSDSVLVVADSLPKAIHRVCISMANEGYKKRPEFFGFLLDDGCGLPEPPLLPERKIEFIGNSITCGYGVEGTNPKVHFSFATENQYYAYDGITARNLNAQCWVVARSGMGAYRNWGGKYVGNKVNMPYLYDYCLYEGGQELWDFSRFTPDVVCINLGTNDTSVGRYDTVRFVNAYVDFIHKIRSHYHDAPIVLLSGTMIKPGSPREVQLRRLLDNIRDRVHEEGDSLIYRFDLTAEDNSMGWGNDYHPSKQRAQYSAEELTAFLRELMHW